MRSWTLSALLATTLLHGCGGGGASGSAPPPVDNVQAIAVNSGPTGNFPNMVMASVTICVPGTSNCQTIDNVQVDTGSSGLRLLASLVKIPLPGVSAGGASGTYSQCAGFADGVVWGPLAVADVQLSGEKASSVSLQLIQDSASSASIPASCTAQGTPEGSLALLGANGILGVGNFLQDCGEYCARNTAAMYFACTGGGVCIDTTIAVALQVSNPVGFFARDNNGVVLQLPAVPVNGAPSVAGSMIFGIGTQSNNTQAAPAIGVSSIGYFAAIYNGATLPKGFLDSGSGGLYFDDGAVPTCPAAGTGVGDLSGFYCPGTAVALSALPISATIVGTNGVSAAVSASVANAQFLLASQPGAASLNVFNNLAGPWSGSATADTFDFGVPFFLGRAVFTAFEQRSTPAGAGPYVAFQAYP